MQTTAPSFYTGSPACLIVLLMLKQCFVDDYDRGLMPFHQSSSRLCSLFDHCSIGIGRGLMCYNVAYIQPDRDKRMTSINGLFRDKYDCLLFI